MRYFITGASGWIGSAVTRELVGAGHEVTGLARSEAAAARIAALGAEVVRGDLADLDVLRDAAAASDGVVHLGFIHDFADFETSVRVDADAIRTFGETLQPGQVLAIASGVAGLTPGRVATEDDHGANASRSANAHLVRTFADRGIRPMQLRFAPTVHGAGDHGFIAYLAGVARARGVSAYIGDGEHRWAAVHRDDAAHLVRLAIEAPDVADVVHAVAEEGIPTRRIAEAIGERFGLPTASLAPEDAAAHFDWMGRFFGADLAASSTLTRERFGWEPTRPTLLEDIAAGGYDAPADAA
jgi:nucleoside-diphosphate-sugar epimerase